MVMLFVFAGPPDFLVEPRATLLSQGETLHLECSAEGEPTPSIEWRRGKVVLETRDRVMILPNNSLRVFATRLEDSGTYLCMASNPLGSVAVMANVTIQGVYLCGCI